MAAYSYQISSDNRTITFTVTGLSPGDLVFFYIRHANVSENLAPTTSYTAQLSVMVQAFPVLEPNSSYVVNVAAAGALLGAKEFTTGASTGRPSNWSWSGIIASGSDYSNLTAAQWNRFEDRINEFRRYKGLANYNFTRAVSGQTLLVTLFSEAETAISQMNGPVSVPSTRTLSMTYFSTLAGALNNSA